MCGVVLFFAACGGKKQNKKNFSGDALDPGREDFVPLHPLFLGYSRLRRGILHPLFEELPDPGRGISSLCALLFLGIPDLAGGLLSCTAFSGKP
ncbi:hypothetical protein KSC_083300 [Ktedonobacter sp. SOSP1-52]|nr:hypothetical protein KSC_083300 [Ktedonobacter sp. SOSP1-52]